MGRTNSSKYRAPAGSYGSPGCAATCTWTWRRSCCTRRTAAARRSPSSTPPTTDRSAARPPPSSMAWSRVSRPIWTPKLRSRRCSSASRSTRRPTSVGRSSRRRSTAWSARRAGRPGRTSCGSTSRRCSGGRPNAPSGCGRDNSSIDGRRRALLIALGANATFLAVEVVGGFAFGSLALLADAVHMVSDVVGLAMAYAALQFARRPPTDRHTYGFGRTEVLVAQANAVLLLASAIAVTIEALRRLDNPHAIDAAGVLVVGCLGLLVNAGSAVVIARQARGSLNLRGALWHLLADALGSVAVIVAALGTALFGLDRLD